MALPKSTFVMGAVVLALFGLAIRETATTKAPDADDDEDFRDPDAEIAQYQRAQTARAEAELAEATARKQRFEDQKAELSKLFGAEAATMGSVLDGIHWNASTQQLSTDVMNRLVLFARPFDAEFQLGSQPQSFLMDQISFTFHQWSEHRDEVCAKLRSLLHDAWGNPIDDLEYTAEYWTNPVTGARARLDQPRGACSLVFDQQVAPGVWIGSEPTAAVSTSWIGQPAYKLRDTITPISEDAATLVWMGPGLGAGNGATKLTATIRGGKVAGITAAANALPDSLGQVGLALTARYGTPKRPRSSQLVWASRPPIALDFAEFGNFVVTIGKP